MPPCRFAMALALAASLSPLVACGGADKSGGAATTAGKAAPAEIDAAGLKARMDAGKIALIDVRTPSEFADGHAPGAVNIPLDQLAQHRLDEVGLDMGCRMRLPRAVARLQIVDSRDDLRHQLCQCHGALRRRHTALLRVDERGTRRGIGRHPGWQPRV